jgi:transposase-like protein
MKKEKFTIKQFHNKYTDDNACLDEIFNNRYGDLKKCPECDNKFSYHKIYDRKCYACAYCSNQIHPLAGTIFHKSSTNLKNWFFAIFLFSVSKNGVSAKELERQLGVTYKTAWRIAKQIRKLCAEQISKLENNVEADETYYGGKEANKHYDKKTPHTQGRSTKTKAPIIGAVERQGNIVAKVVTNVDSTVIRPFLREHVSIEAKINTDEYKGYNGIDKFGYNHDTVNHNEKQYVKGNTHTNTIEGFWSQLKRSINGTYYFVSIKYLQQYVNEFSWRYNRRESIIPFFPLLIARVVKIS